MGEREDRVLRAIRRVVRAVDMQSHKINTEFHVTVPQLLCLHAIRRNPGATLSGLATEVSLSPSTVNGIADRLEEKGLIRRVRGSQDRRKVYPEMLEKGLAIVESAPPMLQEKFTTRFLRLPEDEQESLARALEMTVQMFDAQDIDASPNLILNEIPSVHGH